MQIKDTTQNIISAIRAIENVEKVGIQVRQELNTDKERIIVTVYDNLI